MASNDGLEPVWFWNPEQENGYLSQWTQSPWEHEGVTYHTAEMWMMIQKAKLFGDEEIAAEMASTSDPAKHKSLGRKARDFDRAKWNENKLRIVEEGTWFKFTASKNAAELKKQLLETGEREIVEASPFDKIWGIGFGAENAEANRAKWGENLLGIALMNVRKRIVEQEKKKAE
ncbi:hypothetical protein FKW77_000936 [Venturia effusa]|uniref:NADAR domain-containing protein n=1 Tax=Venturia effusa TaxID=50376 RepID=A0A517LI06_9PEZI|nr:hypothetical protein FKW77_000936 [Venturia effusa]